MRIRLTLYGLFLGMMLLLAQERMPHYQNNYAFINSEDSELIKPGKAYAFDHFYEKLSQLMFSAKGKLKIMHIGASHVQAGVWSWTLRNSFEELCNSPHGAPGFMFPFSIAKTNHPYFYKSSFTGNWQHQRVTDKQIDGYPMGLSGITGICADTVCSFSFSFNEVAKIEQRSIRKVTIFHTKNDSSYLVRMLPESNIRYTYRNYQAGKTIFYLRENPDSLYFTARKIRHKTNQPFQLYGVLTENNEPSVELYSIGMNGANTASYLKAELFDEHLCDLNPDLVILSIGVNDASGYQFSETRYTNNYEELIQKIRRQNPTTAIILTTNTDFYFRKTRLSPHAPKILASMLENAQRYDAAVWDLHSLMGGNRSINVWLNNNLAQRDRVHFTEAGYKIIATELFDAIMRDYEKYLYKQLR